MIEARDGAAIPDIFATSVGLEDGVYVRFGSTNRRADNESYAMNGNDRNPNKGRYYTKNGKAPDAA